MNSEVLTMMYGSMVCQILKDYESMKDVNEQLHKMGYNMGSRMADELLAKSTNLNRCIVTCFFEDNAETIRNYLLY